MLPHLNHTILYPKYCTRADLELAQGCVLQIVGCVCLCVVLLRYYFFVVAFTLYIFILSATLLLRVKVNDLHRNMVGTYSLLALDLFLGDPIALDLFCVSPVFLHAVYNDVDPTSGTFLGAFWDLVFGFARLVWITYDLFMIYLLRTYYLLPTTYHLILTTFFL